MSPESDTNFELVCSLKANDRVNVKKYRSKDSGLTVVVAAVPGPLVSGYFTLATEAFDDDGLPHTLEHLIFLGSEDYPFKGVLDLLANRNLASGTNAWTDTDHTCYNMTTAGSEGFLNLMPIYIDHILFPTLTEAGFITEVHHVTGEGQDAGVVYCEMEGRENSGESRVHLEMLRAAYPGHCGYKSETGGLKKNLRDSTDNNKVRQYHKDFYRPENLTLIVIGQVDEQDVLNVLQPIEKKLKEKGPRGPFQRPWQGEVPRLPKSVDLVVPYASDEEDNGMVYVAWRGPCAVNQLYEMSACSMLLRYLTETSISPLQAEFVEVANPLASSVGFSLLENAVSLLYVSFENVPVDKLSEVKPRLESLLRQLSTESDQLDMKRLRAVINKQKLETLLNLETQPQSAIAFMIIGDVLYGNTQEQLEQRLNPVRDLDKMTEESESFWLGLLKKYLVEGPSVAVRGKPSIAERARLATEEEIRINEQIEKLGPEGLAKKNEELMSAINENERPPPSEMLNSKPIPDANSIHFHELSTYSLDTLKPTDPVDLNAIPLYTHLDSISTNFVYMMILLDTSKIPENLRFYLPLYIEAITESPILRDGILVPYKSVVAELESDTVAVCSSLGIKDLGRFSCGPYSQTMCLALQVEPAKYEKGVKWLHELLYCTEFTAERLSIIAAKMINEVAEFRRKGAKVGRDVLTDLNYTKGANNHYVSNMIRQQKFLSDIGKKLMEGSGNAVLQLVEELRKKLTDPSNIALRLAVNLETLPLQVGDITAPWKTFLPKEAAAARQKLPVTPDWKLINAEHKPSVILGLGSIESAFLCQSVPCISDPNHPDLPALIVFLNYLTQLEGPMWKQIRGLGLSYGYDIAPRISDGLLYLSFYRSTNIMGAYNEAKSIVESYLKGEKPLDPLLLDSAISSMVFTVIQREKTIADLVLQSVIAYFGNVGIQYNRELVKKIVNVRPSDLLRVGQKYVTPLFDPKQAKMSLVCHPSKADEVSQAFTELGFAVNTCQSLNNFFLN